MVGRVAAEELVPRPIERVYVQRGGVLPGRFGVGVHLGNRFVPFVIPLLKVDGRRDGRHHGKELRMLVRYTERSLPAHARTEKANLWRPGPEPLCDKRKHVL